MTDPRGYTRKQIERVKQVVKEGTSLSTIELDATTTTETIKFGIPVSKVSYCSSGGLAGTIIFSVDGVAFVDSTVFASGTPGSYNTHNVIAIKVTRTAGTGKLVVAAK